MLEHLCRCVLALAPAFLATVSTAEPYASTYVAASREIILLRSATVLTGTGVRMDATDILIASGRISEVGTALFPPASARVIDAGGKWVTPGLIDAHSHLGVMSSPYVAAPLDGNEATAPDTSQVWVEHSVNPQAPGFALALAGGVTSMQILPGSWNLIGGRSVVLRNVSAVTYQAMKFPGAPQGLKMTCGENPKQWYGAGRKQAPSTRMANVAGYRAAWLEARGYLRKRELAAQGKGEAPPPDLRLETLADVLDGRLQVHQHCYRAEEMATVLDVAAEFGYRVAAFHHAADAYKIADLLATRGVCAAMWADPRGFKLESYDGIRENVAIVDAAAGSCAIVHSDSEESIQRLNQEAAKAMARGRRIGLEITPEHAITWITANPAKALGILTQVGTLEAGKRADVVVWDGDPFSVYTHAEKVFIDGELRYDRTEPERLPRSDFMLGQPAAAESTP
jgi:imidazolonepropionase-like amidohydrolase